MCLLELFCLTSQKVLCPFTEPPSPPGTSAVFSSSAAPSGPRAQRGPFRDGKLCQVRSGMASAPGAAGPCRDGSCPWQACAIAGRQSTCKSSDKNHKGHWGCKMSSGVETDPGQELGQECTKCPSSAGHGEDGVELSVEVRVVPCPLTLPELHCSTRIHDFALIPHLELELLASGDLIHISVSCEILSVVPAPRKDATSVWR